MERIYGKPIITQGDMHRRIRELGNRISEDYEGKDLVLVGVLKGAFAFYADLVRAIQLPLMVDFLVVSSYGSKAKTSGRVKIISDLTTEIKGHDVLLVEDIVDSGMTLSFLRKKLMARHPESLRVCTLLEKPERRKADVVLDYVGFSIPDKYVVGYGLDYQGKYRNLPYIAVLDKVGE
ncbi:MAG: hypoxanthine phosphoribosyltransferase [Nitrospiria bacterium]